MAVLEDPATRDHTPVPLTLILSGDNNGRSLQQRTPESARTAARRFDGHHGNGTAGLRVVRSLGVVRGITVRSRSIVGNFLGGLQTIFGGNITIYTELCEQAREETYRDMAKHARMLGANAIIAMRYDATDVMTGLTEVLCYGTAVVVEPVRL